MFLHLFWRYSSVYICNMFLLLQCLTRKHGISYLCYLGSLWECKKNHAQWFVVNIYIYIYIYIYTVVPYVQHVRVFIESFEDLRNGKSNWGTGVINRVRIKNSKCICKILVWFLVLFWKEHLNSFSHFRTVFNSGAWIFHSQSK